MTKRDESNSRDSHFLEVVLRQSEKYPQVDILFLQQGEVLGVADLLQEFSQVLRQSRGQRSAVVRPVNIPFKSTQRNKIMSTA